MLWLTITINSEDMASDTFKFIVGPSKKVFNVYPGVVSRSSKPLDRLMNNGMLETREQCVTLHETDEETFFRFTRFLYNGDYDIPDKPKPSEVNGKAPGPLCHAVAFEREFSAYPRQRALNQSTYGRHIPPVIGTQTTPSTSTYLGSRYANTYVSPVAYPPYLGRPLSSGLIPLQYLNASGSLYQPKFGHPIRSQTTPVAIRFNMREDFPNIKSGAPDLYHNLPILTASMKSLEILQAHIQIYLFADLWEVKGLGDLVLQKVHRILQRIQLGEIAGFIVLKLVRFVYSRTNDRKFETVDGMRALVAHFVACHMDVLFKDKNFQEFLKEAGEFNRDWAGHIISSF